MELYDKWVFEIMIENWLTDHPENYDLSIGEPEKDKSGNWIAYAETNKSTYILYDRGNGNIALDYIDTK